MDPSRQPQAHKIIRETRPTSQINGKAEYPWRDGNALYLVGSEGCALHGSTTTRLKPKYRQQNRQQLVKAVQSEQKLNSGLATLWHPYFVTRMIFCLSTILKKVKPLTATIIRHYWID